MLMSYKLRIEDEEHFENKEHLGADKLRFPMYSNHCIL